MTIALLFDALAEIFGRRTEHAGRNGEKGIASQSVAARYCRANGARKVPLHLEHVLLRARRRSHTHPPLQVVQVGLRERVQSLPIDKIDTFGTKSAGTYVQRQLEGLSKLFLQAAVGNVVAVQRHYGAHIAPVLLLTNHTDFQALLQK